MGARLTAGAAGMAMLGFGAWNLLNDSRLSQKESIGKWLVGGVVVHDGILAPIVFAGCALAWRLTGARLRRGLAVFLLAGGSVLIVALPSALRGGDNPNPTVTPLDYPRNLAVVLGGLAVCVLLYVLGGHLNDRRRRGKATEPEPGLTQPARPEDSEATEEVQESRGAAEPPESVDDPVASTQPEEPPGADGATDSDAPGEDGETVIDRDEKLDGQG